MNTGLHKGQLEVIAKLWGNNVSVRVGRRWGKSHLTNYLLVSEYTKGGKCMCITPSATSEKKEFSRSALPRDYYHNSSEDFSDFPEMDLVILKDFNRFNVGFNEYFPLIEAKAKRVIAIGTAEYIVHKDMQLNNEMFARLPFRDGWMFYSGPSFENPRFQLTDLEKEWMEKGTDFRENFSGI